MITVERRQGTPIERATYTATLETWALTLKLPWGGGAVYNRPASVLIHKGDEVRRVPIVDVTQLALLAIGLTTTLIILIIGGQHDG